MKKYFAFSGTATRSEYWGVNVLMSVIFFGAVMIGAVIAGEQSAAATLIGSLVILAGSIASLWTLLAVAIKRCRDAGLNPWWILAELIPYVGFVVWIVIGVVKTQPALTEASNVG